MTIQLSPLHISDLTVRQVSAHHYCINDLHRAAGSIKKDQPSNWLATDKIQNLVRTLHIEMLTTGKTGVEQNQPVISVNGGNNQGTYVVKELVYAYAMWISPEFMLKVIRAFDEMYGITPTTVQKPATFHDMVQSKYDLTVKPDGGPRQTVSEILKTCGIAHTNANMARLHSLLQNEGYVMGVYQGKRGYRMAQVDRGLPANTTPATFDQNHISFDEPGSYILDVQRYGVTVTHVPFGKRIMING